MSDSDNFQSNSKIDKGRTIQGGAMLAMGFCFRSEFFFFWTTRELEFLFFLSRNFPEFNFRLYDKISESGYFFFLHQNQNIFSATLGIRIFFLEKTPKKKKKF
jgi:hypothetical protein